MGRTVRLSTLTEAEKDRILLVLHGLASAQRDVLRQHAAWSPAITRELERLEATYGPRLWILDRAYSRESAEHRTERLAVRNQARWERIGTEATA